MDCSGWQLLAGSFFLTNHLFVLFILCFFKISGTKPVFFTKIIKLHAVISRL